MGLLRLPDGPGVAARGAEGPNLRQDTSMSPGAGRESRSLYPRLNAGQGTRSCESAQTASETVHRYEDHDSGSRPDRPQFQQMFRDGAARKFDVIVFWSLDRFTREGTLATLKYLELLEQHGIRWRSVTETCIDSAGPFRDVLVSL